MYTVAELIEALQKCPQDYEVRIGADCASLSLESVGINDNENTVDLIAE